ncbi:MAG: Ig-like domain-containing protein, partial [Nitrospirota bacterium]
GLYLNHLSWIKSGAIGYVSQNTLSLIYPEGFFNFKDVSLNQGENLFHAISTDSSGNVSPTSEEISVIYDTSLMPDLETTPDDIFIYPPYPIAGEDVVINITVLNKGQVDVRDVDVDIYLWDSSGNLGLLKSDRIPYISSDSGEVIGASWNSADRLGINTVIAVIDPQDKIQEFNETNNFAMKEMVVTGAEGISMTTTLNSDRYQVSQDVNIHINLKNSGMEKGVTVMTTIEDENGNIVASLSPINTSLPYASRRDFDLLWNTGFTYAGLYRVHSILKDASGIMTENIVPFTILPDINIDASIVTDKTNYRSRENVSVSVNIKNNGKNYIVPDLLMRLNITDQNSNILFTEDRRLTNLIPDATNMINSIWNTGIIPPGVYNVFVDIYINNQLISTKTTSFTIDPSVTITGSITAIPSVVIFGNTFRIDYEVQNSGNINISTLPVKIIVIDPESQAVMNSGENIIDLQINGSRTGQFIFSTQGYGLKTYIVILQYSYLGNTKNVASTSFTVKDGVPPMVNIISPVSGSYFNSKFDLVATATDNASGVDGVEYQIDGGVWKLLPVSDASSGRYSTTWAPVLADEGTHTINFRATDKAGNTSLPVSTTVKIEVIFGTIAAQPNPVYQGRDENFTYTITSSAHENITNLTVKVLVIDQDTQQVKQTFDTIADIPMNTTITGNFISSTLNLSPKTYLAILQVSTVTMPEPKTLASTTFEVKPSLELTKKIPDVTNLLVWVNDGCEEDRGQNTEHRSQKSEGNDNEDDDKCIRRDLLERILKEAAESYFIVFDKKDFQNELRNPYYIDILILGDHHPLEDHYPEELREKVYSGTGIISFLWLRHGEDEDEDGDGKKVGDSVFGVRYKGEIAGDTHTITTVQSPITADGLINAKGKAYRVEARNGAAIAGWIKETDDRKQKSEHKIQKAEVRIQKSDDEDDETQEHPAIVLNDYGKGRAVYLAFDLGLTLNDANYNQLAAIMKNAIAYIHKPLDTTAFHPNQVVPVELRIKSLGSAFDLKITETYPAEIKLYDPVTGNWITENPWIMNIRLEPDEAVTILYYALAPDKAGTYALKTEVGYMDNGQYNFYQNIETDILVGKDSAAAVNDIIIALNALSLTGKDKGKINDAIKHMEKVQNRPVANAEDMEKNIHDIWKAVDSLLSITSADISSIRLMMDSLLEAWEGRWYFNYH